jgi:hypothetical protein
MMAIGSAALIRSRATETLPPEHDLLLVCARMNLAEGARARLQRLVGLELDWGRVVRLAVRHGVAPLVYHHLSQTDVSSCADLAVLRQRFFTNASNSVMLARELDEVLTRFDEAGIAAIPYKGPVLAAFLYGNLALRESIDLDVLVKPDDVFTAKEMLRQQGYEPENRLTAVQERALLRARTSYFMRFDRALSAGAIAFELHWRIPAAFPVDERGIWQRLQSARLLDRSWPHFAPEDMLPILCMHGFKHAWNTLKWICDVAELIDRSPELDWDFVVAQSRRGTSRVLLLGCALAQALLSAQLPARIGALIAADAVVPSLAGVLCRRLFDRPLPRVGVINNLRIRERPLDKIRYGFDVMARLTIPTAAEKASWPAQPGARFVRYLTHPARLALRVAGKYRTGHGKQQVAGAVPKVL